MIRSGYSPRKRVGIDFAERGKTVQYFKDECDINNILTKYENGDPTLWTTKSRPRYGDFSEVVDYQTAQNALIQANTAFMELSAEIRAQFGNDPAKFVEFCMNQDNLEEMRRMGLAPEAQEIPAEIMKANGTEPAETTE